MPLVIGASLGPYQIIAPLGVGGMGEVYRARDNRLNREVALKVLPDAFTTDLERVARFQREAQLLASLNHPNIGAIYGLEGQDGREGEPLALVLELVEGPTLADRIAQGPIPLDEAQPIARQIADALEAAHEQGVIHRDLKPANIKVRDDGSVKVLDFGLAKMLEAGGAGQAGGAGGPRGAGGARADGAQGLGPAAVTNSPTLTTPAMTMGSVILGTALYMSPEQAKGRPADKRSDVWAFGCVLYEMLTGKRAFDGEDVSDTLAAVLRGEPDWTALPGHVPPAVRVLIQRCLTKDRRQRVGDIAAAHFVLADPSSLTTTDARTPIVPPVRQPRWRSAIRIAAPVLLTALLVGTAVWNLRPSVSPPTVARFSYSFSEDEQQLTNAGRQFIAISPDGTQTVRVASQRLWLRSISEFDGRAIPGVQMLGIHSPAFSPDGRSLVFFGEQALRRISLAGGAAVTVCQAAVPFGVTWDASGIIFGQGGVGIVRCPAGGGAREQLASVNADEQAHGPQLLPDGEHLLFTIAKERGAARWDQAQVVVQNLKSGERKTVINGGSDGRYLPSGHLLYAVGGVMLAVPFDLRRLQQTSSAVPVLEGVARARGAATGQAHVAVASSGTLVYVPGPVSPSSNSRQLAIADRAGVVKALMVPAGPCVHVRTSRDGKHVVLGSDDGKEAIIWIYELAGTSAIRRLTLDGHNRFPIWSPDGQRVAFQSDREGDLAIFAMRADGTGAVERLTKPGKGDSHVPGSWSPDGKHLAFSAQSERSRFSLHLLSIDDKKTTPYGNVESIEPIEPGFSPDGKWIAYASAPATTGFSPNRGVFVQPFPATGARYQVPKQQIDFHPLWSPDGGELFFTPTAASGRLATVKVSLQPVVAFGTPESFPAKVTAERLSGDMRAFDVLPDGRFIGLTSDSGADGSPQVSQLRVVLNWIEELKQRVPVN